MTKEQRHEIIMEMLIKHGSVLVSDLVELLEVSAVTVRKDLTELEKSDKLYRSHGRAVLINPYINNRSVNEKEKLATDEKHAIGREAARLIMPDDSICIASGTTVHALARNIQPVQNLTVVSASLKASMYLSQDSNIDIIQLGGMLRHSSLSVVGSYGETFLQGCSFSKRFLGVDGIDLTGGATNANFAEVGVKRLMLSAAARSVIVADHTKFGRVALARICDLKEVSLLITDKGIEPEIMTRMKKLGIQVETV